MARTARKRGYSKERADAYIYGGLRAMGWKPSREKKKRKRKKWRSRAKSYARAAGA